MCEYCQMSIDKETWGWGYYIDGYVKHYFHSECLETQEEVVL